MNYQITRLPNYPIRCGRSGDAEDLHTERTSARAVELRHQNSLPLAEHDFAAADLQREVVPEKQGAEMRVGVHPVAVGVIGVVVTNNEGVIIRSTLGEASDTVENYPSIITEIVDRARLILRDNDELTFLKIRTKKIEYIVVPEKEYSLITLLNASNDSS